MGTTGGTRAGGVRAIASAAIGVVTAGNMWLTLAGLIAVTVTATILILGLRVLDTLLGAVIALIVLFGLEYLYAWRSRKRLGL